MFDLMNIQARLRAVEDQLEIQGLAARFSDAVNERNVEAFRRLWKSDCPIWEIGPPLQSRAEGIDEIVAMLRGLMQAERYFMQMTHSGVIEIKAIRQLLGLSSESAVVANQLTTTIWLFMKMYWYVRQTVGASRNVRITTASWIKIHLEATHFQSPNANSEKWR